MDLFADKLEVDDRNPILGLELGHFCIEILPPKLAFYVQICLIILLDMFISAVLGAVIYLHIVQKQNSSTSFLAGFGVVLPLALLTPFQIANSLDIRSRTLRMGLACVPICTSLKCLEAIYGNAPPHATSSLQNYIRYSGSLLETKTDKEDGPTRTTLASLTSTLTKYLGQLAIISVLFSWLVPVEYAPLSSNVDTKELYFSMELAHLCNNFAAAVLTSCALSFSMYGVSLMVQILNGVQIEQVVDNPMFSSKSPSDFWGRRWNRLVHGGLKRGIYKPVRRQFSSKALATLTTFLASGLLHEYVSALLFFANVHEQEDECHVPPFGKHLLFFGWNGCLLLLEYLLGDFFAWVPETLPPTLVSVLVVLTALPVGHWFTGDLIAGGYFSSLQLAFPLVVVTRK